MTAPPRYPVLLDLAGRRCVVVGGGAVAARKVAGLRDAGAVVTVIAPRLVDALAGLAAAHDIEWHERAVDIGDERAVAQLVSGGPAADPPGLVVAATDDPVLNRAIARAGAAQGTWVTDVTDPTGGPASAPAVHRAGPVTVAVSTAGVSPSAAAWLRDELAAAVDPAVVVALELLAEVMAEAAGRREGEDEGAVSGHLSGRIRRSDWRSLLDSGMLDDIREGHRAKAKERLQACLSSSSD